MDKIDRILKVISDKTDALHEDYSNMNQESSNDESKIETLAMISILNEVYNEVELIKEEND